MEEKEARNRGRRQVAKISFSRISPPSPTIAVISVAAKYNVGIAWSVSFMRPSLNKRGGSSAEDLSQQDCRSADY